MLAACLCGTVARAADSPILSTPPTRQFPSVQLRGYGTISGSFWELPGGSVLQIDCDGPDTAKLTHAKFLSDYQLQPTVKTTDDHAITAEAQGSVAAYLEGDRVIVLAAKDQQSLRALIQKVKPQGETAPQTQVPMWLDRWDKYCFRHYYSAWATPKGVKLDDYNFAGDFEWAEKELHAGVLVSAVREGIDTADNMMASGWIKYVADEAALHNLPVDIHLGTLYGSDPTWFVNRYRDQIQTRMPGFAGNFHVLMSPYLGGQGVLSWNATTAEDAALGMMQDWVRKYASQPNVTSFLEPHNETFHGAQDLFMEYGPVADANYRKYLQEKYKSVEAVAARWQQAIASWDDVRVPEMSSFLGDGPDALDVGGLWHVKYEELLEAAKPPNEYIFNATPKSTPAPKDWYLPSTDDSQWPLVPSGSNCTAMFLQKRPAVFRREFDLPAAYKEKNPHIWLYVWDFNAATRETVRTVLNGQQVGEEEIGGNRFHWQAMDVTSALREGKNLLAIRVPQGFIEYKTYLSPKPPRQYPDLGEAMNAQWVDFIDFTQWSRIQAMRRGIEMIREAAPNQGVTFMHPDEFSDGLKDLCVRYGGEFHNTGYMGAFYADYNTTVSRGADLPYSIEPSTGPHSLQGWQHDEGMYQTEGVQAIDEFIHLGDLLWNPEIKADYEAHRHQLELMGQSHFPKAQIALLFSDRVLQLMNYPWKSDPNTVLDGGYWKWNAGAVLRGSVPYDALTQSSFANKEAGAYPMVIDSSTSMMDPDMVQDIERYVRNGGVFVTLGQTGRSTPEKHDAWPINELTGYAVTKIDHFRDAAGPDEHSTLKVAADQEIFGPGWNGVTACGLHLKKLASDTQDLLYWVDGSVAVGMRPLGKGYVIELGANFTGATLPDRLEPGQWTDPLRHQRDLLLALTKWRRIAPEPGRLVKENEEIILRHGVTNNGLFDTWTLFNQNKLGKGTQTVSLAVDTLSGPSFAIDMLDGSRREVTNSVLENIVVQPLETKVFLTPHAHIDQAPAAWFDLQRKWWRGVGVPGMKELPDPKPILARELTQDWKFRPLDASADATPLLAANVDDSNWETRPMQTWDTKQVGTGHAVFRRSFTVPPEWNNGPISIWISSWNMQSFLDEGRVFLDGKQVKPMGADPYRVENDKALQAGATHELAVEVKSTGSIAGLRGESWIAYDPLPPEKLDLAGQWIPSSDGLHDEAPIALPGHFNNVQFFKRNIFVDEKYRGKTATITIDGDHSLICVLINGKLQRRGHGMMGERGTMNITPLLEYGKDNEIQIVAYAGPTKGEVRETFLGFFDQNPWLASSSN